MGTSARLFFNTRSAQYSPRGGDRGSGSSWIYDGGAIVRKGMEIGKPLILVSIK